MTENTPSPPGNIISIDEEQIENRQRHARRSRLQPPPLAQVAKALFAQNLDRIRSAASTQIGPKIAFFTDNYKMVEHSVRSQPGCNQPTSYAKQLTRKCADDANAEHTNDDLCL
jgi:hypothetical protein